MKKLLVIVSLVLCGTMANASELYWQLADGWDTKAAEEGWSSATLGTIKLYASNGYTTSSADVGGAATLIKDLGDASGLKVTDLNDIGLVASDISGESTSASYFFIELANSSGERIAASNLVSGDALRAAIYEGGMSSIPTAVSFGDFSSESVPEPTSGLLVLVGAMLLGLKRKNV